MEKIQRNDLFTTETYVLIRPYWQKHIIALKKRRRLAIGPHMSLVFENRQTVLYQIQEILRVEPSTRGDQIERALATYNQAIPAPGELSATLFLEFCDRDAAATVLAKGDDPADHLAMRFGGAVASGRCLRSPEQRQPAAVSHLRFAIDEQHRAVLGQPNAEITIEITHDAYKHRACIPPAMRREFAIDLADADMATKSAVASKTANPRPVTHSGWYSQRIRPRPDLIQQRSQGFRG